MTTQARPSESQIQRGFVEWVQWKHPNLSDYLIKIPNEGKRSASYATKMKKEGLRSGVPDIFFAKPSERPGTQSLFHGLWLEIKAPKRKPSPQQVIYIALLNDAGYLAVWFDNLDDIIWCFEDYVARIPRG